MYISILPLEFLLCQPQIRNYRGTECMCLKGEGEGVVCLFPDLRQVFSKSFLLSNL